LTRGANWALNGFIKLVWGKIDFGEAMTRMGQPIINLIQVQEGPNPPIPRV